MTSSPSKKGRGKQAEARSCTGKIRYPSKEDAVNAANAMRRRTTMKMNVYKCKFCWAAPGVRGWHFGNKTSLSRRLSR